MDSGTDMGPPLQEKVDLTSARPQEYDSASYPCILDSAPITRPLNVTRSATYSSHFRSLLVSPGRKFDQPGLPWMKRFVEHEGRCCCDSDRTVV